MSIPILDRERAQRDQDMLRELDGTLGGKIGKLPEFGEDGMLEKVQVWRRGLGALPVGPGPGQQAEATESPGQGW